MLLEAVNLVKLYGGRTALDRVSFSLARGETAGFLGVNGAGKSTAMRILAGYLAPSAGQARIAGRDPRRTGARKKIGYLPEANPLPSWMRVGEYLLFRAGLKTGSRSEARRLAGGTAERCRIAHLRDRRIGGLSKGTRQRVGLADCLLGNPEVLILDEPTSGLDPAEAGETRRLIAEAGETGAVLLSSHLLRDIESLCPRVIILDRGRVARDGTLAALIGQYAGERTLRLEVEAGEGVLETFLALPGVTGGELVPDGAGGGAVVRLTLAAGAEVRREAALAALRKGWLVTEMRLEPIRLEDVFRRFARPRAGAAPEADENGGKA
ncbi:MAG: ABC transporter ATP-binding protein [Planctomycetota bacterium]|jgi:ABC-2 type transport system ATP-binding protein|nr:ABC transporter ATP-binding protein [Planctomycetota bacterium]